MSVFITIHATPIKIDRTIPGSVLQLQAESQSSTIAQAVLDFITDLFSTDRNNINNSGESHEKTPSSESGKGSTSVKKRFTYLNPNVLYYLDSLMTRDAKLRRYKIDSAENFGWKYSNSDTPQTSTSYPRKVKQDGYQ